MTALRDSLRNRMFSNKASTRLVPIGVPAEGEEQQYIEVMAPKVGDMIDNMDAPSQRHRLARMLIDSCFVPGTSEKVFEEADFDSLMDLPSSGDYSALMAAITDSIAPKEQEAAAKK